MLPVREMIWNVDFTVDIQIVEMKNTLTQNIYVLQSFFIISY